MKGKAGVVRLKHKVLDCFRPVKWEDKRYKDAAGAALMAKMESGVRVFVRIALKIVLWARNQSCGTCAVETF